MRAFDGRRRANIGGRRGRLAGALGLVAAMLLLASTAGCGSAARAQTFDAVVPVDLANFKITMPSHVHAGLVKFVLAGVGPTMHEFNVVRTDIAPSELPLATDGTVDDQNAHADFEHLAEREGVDIGGRASLIVRLRPGHYVVYCNMYGHYQAGMHAEVTVP